MEAVSVDYLHTDRSVSVVGTSNTIVPTSASAYSDYSTRNSNMEQFIKHGGQINFYEMKALYTIINMNTKLSIAEVEDIVKATCE